MASRCVQIRNSNPALCLFLGLLPLSLLTPGIRPPVISPSPNHHDILLVKILFIGHWVVVQVGMVAMGMIAAHGLDYIQGGLVSIPSQRLHS